MRRIASWLRVTIGARLAGQRAGQGLVEFAFVALFALLPMTLGLIEVGRGVWYYNQISQLSREGARWLIVVNAKDQTDGTTRFDDIGNAAYGSYEYALSACGCADDTAVGWIGQMATGLERIHTRVLIRRDRDDTGTTWTLLEYQHGRPIYVRVTYNYHPLVTSLLNIPATIPMQAATTMNVE